MAIEDKIKLLEEWDTTSTIQRKMDVLTSNIKMSLKLSDIDNSSNADILDLINKMTIPADLIFEFWVLVNEWCNYWVNSCNLEMEDLEIKEVITECIFHSVIYGTSVFYKENGEFKTGTVSKVEKDRIEIIENNFLKDNGTIPAFDGFKIDFSNKPKKYVKSDYIIFNWRREKIGDFCWCLKDLLKELYFKRIIEVNASNLLNSPIFTVNNTLTAAEELNILRNPLKSVKIIVDDSEGRNLKNQISFLENAPASNINDLILILKHHQEYYYSKYGRPISNAKEQTHSSDVNLSVSGSSPIANEHYERVELFLYKLKKQFGIECQMKSEIEELKENINSDSKNGNDNAEFNKNGSGEISEVKEKTE